MSEKKFTLKEVLAKKKEGKCPFCSKHTVPVKDTNEHIEPLQEGGLVSGYVKLECGHLVRFNTWLDIN